MVPAWPSWLRGTGSGIGIWVASRIVLVGWILLGTWLIGFDAERRAAAPLRWVVMRFVQFDSHHFIRIADHGYFPWGRTCCDQAFFPAYPMSMRMLSPLVGGDTALAGLVIALLAGAAASAALWHLAVSETADGRVGTAAVAALALSPYAFFLSSVYSESLFLASAIGAWWAGTREHWWVAGLVGGLAALVRVSGVFLAAGLVVMYVLQRRRSGSVFRWDALALLGPILATAGYVSWLRHETGSWTTWMAAQAFSWERHLDWPWVSLRSGWNAIQNATSVDLAVARWGELVAVAIGIVLLTVLAEQRRWAEVVYVGTSLLAMLCSTVLMSVPRTALLWFPGYLLLARLVVRRPQLKPILLATSIPLLMALALTFSTHHWIA